MEKKILYIANDGKTFDSEKSCIEYEKERDVLSTIKMCRGDYALTDDVNCADFLILDTQEKVDIITKEMEEYVGVVTDGIDGCGIYMYNDSDYVWINLGKKIAELTETYNKLKNL